MVDMRTDGEMAYSGFGNLEQSYKGHNRVGPNLARMDGCWLVAENKNDNGGSRWKRDGGGVVGGRRPSSGERQSQAADRTGAD
jgi:hypothetical protein